MQNLNIEETGKTPGINFNTESGQLIIKGRSIPENSLAFYQPVLDCMDEYCNSPKEKTSIIIQLDYFSTSSSKCILDLFKKLENLHKLGKNTEIQWLFEENDENIRDAGADYQSMVEVPFQIIPISG
ncbi:MAG: DUF1987 domain-containing protein [Sphingobacteriaceae bacterium]|nr:DUF1987 domain-containing protein [Sphingobacteriaceae bacterium]